jgi:hypothetical protein
VYTRVGLDAVETRIISFLCRESNPGHSARNPVAIPNELSRLSCTRFIIDSIDKAKMKLS